MADPSTQPTEEELDDMLFDARFDELESLQSFASRFGTSHFATYLDERGNSCLHMASANGHVGVVSYLLPLLPTSALIRPNSAPAQNTPLHWAAMNHHLPVLKLLCPRMTTDQVSATNGRGRSAMSEAMEGVGMATRMPPPSTSAEGVEEERERLPDEAEKRREECVAYLVEQMKLGDEERQESGPPPGEQEAGVVNGVNGLKVSS